MDIDALVLALVERAGGTLPVAKAMGMPSFQGTLHKLAHGAVKSPSRSTAERVARYFHIPIDALYDKRVAAKVYAERFGPGAAAARGNAPTLVNAEEPTAGYRVDAPTWPLPRIDQHRLATLDKAVLRDIETAMLTMAGHHGVDISKRRAA